MPSEMTLAVVAIIWLWTALVVAGSGYEYGLEWREIALCSLIAPITLAYWLLRGVRDAARETAAKRRMAVDERRRKKGNRDEQ